MNALHSVGGTNDRLHRLSNSQVIAQTETKMNTEFPFAAAFQAFYSDDEAVKAAIDLATQQELYGPSTACVELFDDGTYRVLPSVGNLYNSRGVLVSVPALQDDEISEDGDNWYDAAIEA